MTEVGTIIRLIFLSSSVVHALTSSAALFEFNLSNCQFQPRKEQAMINQVVISHPPGGLSSEGKRRMVPG